MNEKKHLTPVWIIYADGRRLDTVHEGALRSITVKDCLNGLSSFSLIFDTAEAKIREEGLLSMESEVTIHLGYKDDVEAVFSGEVVGFRGIYSDSGSEQLEVTGSSALHKLDHGSRHRGYEGKKPSDVIKLMLEGYSLKGEVEDFGAAREYHTEETITDFDYLMEMAGAYGKEVYADGSTVYVKDEITIKPDEVIYEWGKSLFNLDASQNILGVVSEVECIGQERLKEECFTGKASMKDIPVKLGGEKDWSGISKGGSGVFVDTYVDMSCKDTEEAKQIAIGRLQKNSYKFICASGKGEGNHKLRPGMRVTIKMVGGAFEGEYMAESVTHNFDRLGGYRTDFTLKRNMSP